MVKHTRKSAVMGRVKQKHIRRAIRYVSALFFRQSFENIQRVCRQPDRHISVHFDVPNQMILTEADM
jgi:hypothetical protein